ncbi:HtaA domain-containing protein [Microbacterium sp. NPDC089189]|uniref:HtaA domain-containing protein n=1 Tax=Microbacterium sp. NPDC089189 TaxID=3154972 RepID=UPI0034245BAF
MRRRLAPLALVALSAAIVGGAVAPAHAAAPAATSSAAGCTVAGGQLTWGFKESFRSYISGTIAKGAWEPIDGASYTTPEFSWPAQSGSIDPETGTGTISFGGGIRFTGHNGLLDTTVANPTLEVTGPTSAQLRLDVTGLSMDDALAGNTENVHTATQVAFVDLDLASVPAVLGDASFTGTGVPTAVTADGYAAFGSYEAGSAFDPLTFDVQLDCAVPEPTPTPVETTADIETTAAETTDEAADPTWLWWVGGGVLAAGAAAGVIALVRRGARRGADRGDRP